MKITLKQNIAFILCLMLFFSLSAVMLSFQNKTNVFALETEIQMQKQAIIQQMSAYETKIENERLYNLMEAHIASRMGENLRIEKIKNLHDFNGNQYTLCELSPIGYIIYHNVSGKFIEYSPSSESPYFNYYGDLYYGGIGEFYYKSDNTLFHTKIATKIIDVSKIELLTECSQNLSENYAANIYDNNLAYVKGTAIMPSMESLRFESEGASTKSLRVSRPYRISMYDFFIRLKNGNDFGYVDKGACGYIAANLLIAFNYFATDYSLALDQSMFNLDTYTLKGGNLTKSLMRINGVDLNADSYPGTVGEDLAKVMRAYLYGNYSWEAYSNILEFGVTSSLDKGYPVALFGFYPNPIDLSYGNHAVVAYYYERYGFLNLGLRYGVHYGWENYSAVYLEATGTGSSLFLQMKE